MYVCNQKEDRQYKNQEKTNRQLFMQSVPITTDAVSLNQGDTVCQ
jgi:hypothetical protein